MARTAQKVKAKKFVEDFLSGMDREQLMRVHDLSPNSMDKLLAILVERGILAQDQIDRRFSGKATVRRPTAELTGAREPRTIKRAAESTCPQCGAEVSVKSLTCPECGHLLSGAERWGALKEEKSFFQKFPPWLIGCLIATPAAVLVIYVFVYLLYPMIEADSERKAQARRAQKPVEKVQEETQDDKSQDEKKKEQRAKALKAKKAALEREIHSLVQRRIFAGPDESYRSFLAGSAWSGLSEEQKDSYLRRIRSSMQEAEVQVNFDVKDLWGSTVARVTKDAVMIGDIPLPPEQTSSSSNPLEKLGLPKAGHPNQEFQVDLEKLKLPKELLPGQEFQTDKEIE